MVVGNVPAVHCHTEEKKYIRTHIAKAEKIDGDSVEMNFIRNRCGSFFAFATISDITIVEKGNIHQEQIPDLWKRWPRICGSLSCVSKGYQHVDRDILTGISYFKTMEASKLNNLMIYRLQENHSFA